MGSSIQTAVEWAFLNQT